MMCDDERALLRNIKANPDDDVVRLVYADWLEEHKRGDRAKKIRIAIEHGRKRETFSNDLIRRVWHRGFIVEIGCIMTDWLCDGPDICARHPVQRVEITDRSPMCVDRQGQSDAYIWIPNDWIVPYAAHVPFVIINEDKFRSFDTSEAAIDWLSRRCIEWANAQSELVCHS